MADPKRIYKFEFNEILRKIAEISQAERKYLNQFFANDLVDGLTEWEIRQKVQHLKFDEKDSVNRWDAEKVKTKLLKHIGK